MAFPTPLKPQPGLAWALLGAWSAADAELRLKLETLIAEYAARKPEFVNELKQITNTTDRLEALFTAVRARPLVPDRIEGWVLQYMTPEQGSARAQGRLAMTMKRSQAFPKPNDPSFSLAFTLLNAWSLADDELRPKLEALITDYVKQKPEFVDELRHVTKVVEQLSAVFGKARTNQAKLDNIGEWMIQFTTKREGGAPSA